MNLYPNNRSFIYKHRETKISYQNLNPKLGHPQNVSVLNKRTVHVERNRVVQTEWPGVYWRIFDFSVPSLILIFLGSIAVSGVRVSWLLGTVGTHHKYTSFTIYNATITFIIPFYSLVRMELTDWLI